ncbi:trypsin-like serine protease [Kitasatospora sp. NPDC008050]|uniref:trypsin-like serine protease n=1 Tax=Kitasatospora sp. NPDC008050 TaxID=3364021 RepID=UPI0036E1FD9F
MKGQFPRAGRIAALATAATALTGTTLTGTSALAVSGETAPQNSYTFTAKLTVGDQEQNRRSCSAALVDPSWVLTAAGCFADDPAQGTALAGGAPKSKATVTVGATSTNAGQVADVVQLLPRQDRDLVLAKLSHPVFGIAPVALAATPATAGDSPQIAGWGRTKDEWVPQQAHAGAFGVDSADATTLAISPKTKGAAVCKGDTGGPVLREKNGAVELAAIASRSWQGGCLGESETRTGATASRVDDLAGWVSSAAAQGGPVLAPGTKLASGQSVVGRDLQLTMQGDGNLTITHRGIPGGVLWSSNTAGHSGAWAQMQTDGNFVVYAPDGNPAAATGALWGSNTYPNPGAYLQLQDDGNLVLYKKDGGTAVGGALWSAGTQQFSPLVASNTPIWSFRWSEARSTVLEMQADGNLVLYRKSDGASLWNSGTAGNPGAWLAMQSDGNLVVYKAGGGGGNGGLWASGTWWAAGAYLKLQDDGNLVVYKKEGGEGIGGAIWSTNTFA